MNIQRKSNRVACIAEVLVLLAPFLDVSAQAAMPTTRVPDLNPSQGTRADRLGARLYWVTLSEAKTGSLLVSLGFNNQGQETWVLEAELAPSPAPEPIHQIVADRVQVGFKVGPLEAQHTNIAIILRPSGKRQAMERDLPESGLWRMAVPIPNVRSRTLVPELYLDRAQAERLWYAWDFVVEREGTAVLSVSDAGGHSIRTFPAGYFLEGATTLLWDGLDDSGKQREPGLYFLRIHTTDMVPEVHDLPGRPIS